MNAWKRFYRPSTVAAILGGLSMVARDLTTTPQSFQSLTTFASLLFLVAALSFFYWED